MIEAILVATRDHLRTALPLDERSCGIQPEGRPPAIFGDLYVAIDDGGVEASELNHLKEVFRVEITLTAKVAMLPRDRRDEAYLHHLRGLGELERRVIAALHGSQRWRALANEAASLPQENTGDAFLMPLYYRGRGRTSFASGEWAGLEPQAATFVTRSLGFSGGKRIQALGSVG